MTAQEAFQSWLLPYAAIGFGLVAAALGTLVVVALISSHLSPATGRVGERTSIELWRMQFVVDLSRDRFTGLSAAGRNRPAIYGGLIASFCP